MRAATESEILLQVIKSNKFDAENMEGTRWDKYRIDDYSQIKSLLRSDDYFKTNAQRIMKIREATAKELRKMGFLLTDSSANFLFAKHPDFSGKELYLKLKDAGILIRHFEKDRIRDYNRITVGNEEEMQALLTALKNIIGGKI